MPATTNGHSDCHRAGQHQADRGTQKAPAPAAPSRLGEEHLDVRAVRLKCGSTDDGAEYWLLIRV